MDYIMNSAGSAAACIREYATDSSTDIAKGTIMTLSNGIAVAANTSSIVLGVLASDYKAERDELVPGSGNGRVRVIVSPNALYRINLPETVIETNGSSTSLTVAGLNMPATDNIFKNGYVKLIRKAENSSNTDHVGAARRITASSANALTLEEGGIPCVGDVYAIMPPVGFTYLVLSSDSGSFEFSTSQGQNAKVASSLPENDYFEILLARTFF